MKKTEKSTLSPILKGSNEILQGFNDGLAEIIERDHEPLTRVKVMHWHTNRWLLELKRLVQENPFADQSEEIHVFKYVKPILTANLIYERRMVQIIDHVPHGGMETKLSYYEEELRFIRHEQNLDKFYYDYYRFGLDELDMLGFVRGAEVPFPVMTEVEVPGSDFSTALDYLFAKFRAFDDLLNLIDYLIADLLKPIDIHTDLQTPPGKLLRWTGDSINLVEIAYAIWLTGQLNDGNANISEIIRWMEEHFQVKIGRAHRRWEEISQRKRLSTTKFLDACKEAINKRIDGENALK
ncbi:hypothetical protein HDC92_004327 [Pedobacter sp. AK017]|uniref:RteC domain-containing protein n=1 Tax=Pedobacter sp. AK017 TaxID=2723073 RepID=UPI001607CB84|nr:RteC domain-containing protein [Pedobacter sp. AK017]MBB5440624.1 hypothetical protein [Pedobacter sp. AK017]